MFRRKQQDMPKKNAMPNFQKIAIGKHRLGQQAVTFSDEMTENIPYDNGSTTNLTTAMEQEKVTRIDNPVYIHDGYEPDQAPLPHFSDIANPDKDLDEDTSTHQNGEAPVYAIVNKDNVYSDNDVFVGDTISFGDEEDYEPTDASSEDQILY